MIATLASRGAVPLAASGRGADGCGRGAHRERRLATAARRPSRVTPIRFRQVSVRAQTVAGRAAPAGAIGGAMVTAGRRATGLSRRALACRLAIPAATVRAWEEGTLPLYCVGYDQLRQLARILADAGEPGRASLADLLLASECDLLVAGMLGGFEDYAEVPPIDQGAVGEAARSLLSWALTGTVPDQFRRYGRSHPLLAQPDVHRLVGLARGLAAGAEGNDLSAFGSALLRAANESEPDG